MTEPVPLLDVSDLTVEFSTRRGIVRAVQHVNVKIAKGETVGIVGESGSGKSVTSYAVMRILDRAGRIAEGAVHFTGLDIRGASEDEMRNLRGREISMIFQNPRAALNPIRKVGHQIEDVLEQHSQVDSSALTDKAIEILDVKQRLRGLGVFPISSSSCAGLTRASIKNPKMLFERWIAGSSPAMTTISGAAPPML